MRGGAAPAPERHRQSSPPPRKVRAGLEVYQGGSVQPSEMSVPGFGPSDVPVTAAGVACLGSRVPSYSPVFEHDRRRNPESSSDDEGAVDGITARHPASGAARHNPTRASPFSYNSSSNNDHNTNTGPGGFASVGPGSSIHAAKPYYLMSSSSYAATPANGPDHQLSRRPSHDGGGAFRGFSPSPFASSSRAFGAGGRVVISEGECLVSHTLRPALKTPVGMIAAGADTPAATAPRDWRGAVASDDYGGGKPKAVVDRTRDRREGWQGVGSPPGKPQGIALDDFAGAGSKQRSGDDRVTLYDSSTESTVRGFSRRRSRYGSSLSRALRDLAELHRNSELSDAEYADAKRLVIAGDRDPGKLDPSLSALLDQAARESAEKSLVARGAAAAAASDDEGVGSDWAYHHQLLASQENQVAALLDENTGLRLVAEQLQEQLRETSRKDAGARDASAIPGGAAAGGAGPGGHAAAQLHDTGYRRRDGHGPTDDQAGGYVATTGRPIRDGEYRRHGPTDDHTGSVATGGHTAQPRVEYRRPPSVRHGHGPTDDQQTGCGATSTITSAHGGGALGASAFSTGGSSASSLRAPHEGQNPFRSLADPAGPSPGSPRKGEATGDRNPADTTTSTTVRDHGMPAVGGGSSNSLDPASPRGSVLSKQSSPAGRHRVPGAQGDHQVSMSRQSSPYFAAGAAGGDGFPLTYPSIPSEHGESSEPPLRAAEELYHRQQSVPGRQFRSATAARSEASTPVTPGNTRLADLLDDQPNTGGASVSNMSPTASSARAALRPSPQRNSFVSPDTTGGGGWSLHTLKSPI